MAELAKATALPRVIEKLPFFSMINPFASATNSTQNTEKGINDVQVSVGSSNIVVDGIRNVLSIPMKVILWNSSVNSGNVSVETIEKVKEYLNENGLHDILVSVNQYKPGDVWKRTFTNPKTSRLAKLLGIPTCLMETFLFPKLTGFPGDHYNPLSNTVHLFSNDPAIALHECGHAKDFNSRENPTLYALSANVPYLGSIVTLYHEYMATNNAMTYIKEKKWDTLLSHSFKVLIPAYATYCANAVLPDVSMTRVLTTNSPEELQSLDNDFRTYMRGMGAIVLIGHLIGRVLAAKVASKREVKADPNLEPLPV